MMGDNEMNNSGIEETNLDIVNSLFGGARTKSGWCGAAVQGANLLWNIWQKLNAEEDESVKRWQAQWNYYDERLKRDDLTAEQRRECEARRDANDRKISRVVRKRHCLAECVFFGPAALIDADVRIWIKGKLTGSGSYLET